MASVLISVFIKQYYLRVILNPIFKSEGYPLEHMWSFNLTRMSRKESKLQIGRHDLVQPFLFPVLLLLKKHALIMSIILYRGLKFCVREKLDVFSLV